MILLISIKTLKEEYLIDDNIDDKYILSNIQKGQRFIINGILGDVKYNELLNEASTNTVSAANRYLIEEFVQPILGYFVMSEVIYSTTYKMKNIGVENGDSDRFNELVKISKKYLNDCEHFQQLLRDYICDAGIILNYEGRRNVLKTGIYIDNIKKHKSKFEGTYDSYTPSAPGIPGTSGTSGTSGTDGTSGTSGTSGSSGTGGTEILMAQLGLYTYDPNNTPPPSDVPINEVLLSA